MAIGKRNQNNTGKAYSVKLKLKDGAKFLDCAEFEIQEKQGDKYVVLKGDALKAFAGSDGPIYDVAGDLISVDTRQGEFEGSPILNVTLGLKDSERNEIYFVGYVLSSNLGRGLSNSLLNLQAFNDVQIGLYSQTNKETKKVYPAVALRQGENQITVKWKFDPKVTEELLPRTFAGKGGKTEKDFTDADNFLFAKIAEFGKTVKANPVKSASAPAATQASVENEAPASSGGDEDVPF